MAEILMGSLSRWRSCHFCQNLHFRRLKNVTKDTKRRLIILIFLLLFFLFPCHFFFSYFILLVQKRPIFFFLFPSIYFFFVQSESWLQQFFFILFPFFFYFFLLENFSFLVCAFCFCFFFLIFYFGFFLIRFLFIYLLMFLCNNQLLKVSITFNFWLSIFQHNFITMKKFVISYKWKICAYPSLLKGVGITYINLLVYTLPMEDIDVVYSITRPILKIYMLIHFYTINFQY